MEPMQPSQLESRNGGKAIGTALDEIHDPN